MSAIILPSAAPPNFNQFLDLMDEDELLVHLQASSCEGSLASDDDDSSPPPTKHEHSDARSKHQGKSGADPSPFETHCSSSMPCSLLLDDESSEEEEQPKRGSSPKRRSANSPKRRESDDKRRPKSSSTASSHGRTRSPTRSSSQRFHGSSRSIVVEDDKTGSTNKPQGPKPRRGLSPMRRALSYKIQKKQSKQQAGVDPKPVQRASSPGPRRGLVQRSQSGSSRRGSPPELNPVDHGGSSSPVWPTDILSGGSRHGSPQPKAAVNQDLLSGGGSRHGSPQPKVAVDAKVPVDAKVAVDAETITSLVALVVDLQKEVRELREMSGLKSQLVTDLQNEVRDLREEMSGLKSQLTQSMDGVAKDSKAQSVEGRMAKHSKALARAAASVERERASREQQLSAPL